MLISTHNVFSDSSDEMRCQRIISAILLLLYVLTLMPHGKNDGLSHLSADLARRVAHFRFEPVCDTH